jgi:hypothetical protein
MRVHGLLIATALTAVAGLCAPTGASAATVFGPPIDTLTPTFGTPLNVTTTGTKLAGGASAAAPISGVLTRLRLRRGVAGADPGVYAYRIMSGTSPNLTARPASPSGANDVFLTFKPSSPSGIDSYFPVDAVGHAVGIPITAGEYLAIWTQKDAAGGAAPSFTTSAPGSEYTRVLGDVLGVQQATGPFGGFLLLLEGTIEPDADGDHYGDETQDGCPSNGASHTPCPVPPAPVVVTREVPVPTPVVTPVPTLGAVRQSGDRRSLTATIACPAGRGTSCRGTLTLQTASQVSFGGGRYKLILGSAAFTVRPGARSTARIRLSSSARSLLARRKTLKARVVLQPADGAGSSKALTLRAPKKKATASRR